MSVHGTISVACQLTLPQSHSDQPDETFHLIGLENLERMNFVNLGQIVIKFCKDQSGASFFAKKVDQNETNLGQELYSSWSIPS